MLWKYPSKATAWVLGSFPTSIPEDEKMLKILTTISRNFVAWVALGCDRMLAKFQVFHLWKVTLHKPNTSHCKKKKDHFQECLGWDISISRKVLISINSISEWSALQTWNSVNSFRGDGRNLKNALSFSKTFPCESSQKYGCLDEQNLFSPPKQVWELALRPT